MYNANNRHRLLLRSDHRGFSLVELMVAITLGLVLMVGVTTVVTNSTKNYGEVANTSQQIENGRYALQTLRDDIRNAGYFGRFSAPEVPASLPNSCTFTLEAIEDGMGVPIEGFDDTAPACLTNYLAGTDVLAIRRAATDEPVEVASLNAGDLYIQTLPTEFVLREGSGSEDFTLIQRDSSDAPILPFYYALYFVRSCSICGDNGDSIPTLVRAELRDGALVMNPIAEGIENLQFRFGVDDSENGSPDRYLLASNGALDGEPAGWADVVSVEVNILARSLQPSPGYTDVKEYDLGQGDLVSPGGPYRRHVFTSIVRVINTSSRRE